MTNLHDLISLPDEQAEAAMFSKLRVLDDTAKLGYSMAGLICSEVAKRLLWKQRIDLATGQSCTSMSRWIRVAAPWSWATCHAAMRDVEALADLAPEEIAQIPASNFPVVRQLSTAVRADPEVLRVAQTKPTAELVSHVRQFYPAQHFEARKLLRFTMEESAAERIEYAIAEAMHHGATNRSEALELIATEAMENWRFEASLEDITAETTEATE